MKIETSLPDEINAFQYVKNSHYIKMQDNEKREIKLCAKQVMRGECPKCRYSYYTEMPPQDEHCPRCLTAMTWAWGRAQISFIPEDESDFMKNDK